MFNKVKVYLSKNIVIYLFLFLLIFPFYIRGIAEVTFDIDEHEFLRKSYFYDLFFIKRDLQDPRWYSRDAAEQPKIGTYIYGLGLHLFGVDDIEKNQKIIMFNHEEQWGRGWWWKFWGEKLNSFPVELFSAEKLILFGRKIALLFSFAALILTFSLTFKITKNIIFSSLSTLLLATNTLMQNFGRRAMTDTMQLSALFANLLLLLYYLEAFKKKNKKIIVLISLALGVNCAFGVGVKVSGILIFLFLIIFYLMMLVINFPLRRSMTLLVFSSLITIASFTTVFIFFHPYLYTDTLKHFLGMFTNRLKTADEYRLTYPGSAVYSRYQAAMLIFGRTLLPGGTLTSFKLFNLPWDLFLFPIGFLFMGSKAIRKLFSQREISGELLLTSWTVLVAAGLVYYLRNDWPRYYLPLVACMIVIKAYAVIFLFHKLKIYFSK